MTHFLLLVAIIGWGLSSIFQKIAVQKVGPPTLQVVSSLVTLAILLLYYILQARPVKLEFNQSGFFYSVLAGICSTAGSIAFIYLMKSKDVSAIIGYAACYPLITFIMACLFLGETFTTTRLIGICIVLFGIMVLGK